MSKSPGPQIEIDTDESRSLMTRIIGLILLISAAVLATYLVVAFFAWQSGRQTQTAARRPGDGLAASGRSGAARHNAGQRGPGRCAGLDWVLAQDSGHSPALVLQSGNSGYRGCRRGAVPTATTEPTSEPSATVTWSETDSLPELQEIRRLVAREAWEDALPAILNFQQSNPDYERRETDELLYETYLSLGLQNCKAGPDTELGLNYLSQAERLGNLPQEAQDYRYWGNLYLDGISYYGVNWEIASFYFRDLCAAAPFFQNSCQLLNEVLTNQADQLAFAGEWCPAERLYQELWQADRSPALGDKLSLARENCALATPVPISGTVELTGTLPITDGQP